MIDPNQHVYWLASRTLGVIAIVLLALSITAGLALSGRISRKPGMPARFKHFHEALALTTLGVILAHGLVLLGDKYLNPGFSGVFLPFANTHAPLWTGIGVIAGWLTAIFTLSFYVRKQIGMSVWRWLHRWTLLAYMLAVVHTVGSGSDIRSGWMIVTLIAITVPIVFAGAFRVLPAAKARHSSA